MADWKINALVPYLHVADVSASIDFYKQLGFEVENQMDGDDGKVMWAMLRSTEARLMVALADAPIVPEAQAILLYLYSADVGGLRRHLLAGGLFDGGPYCGQQGPNNGRCVVFEVTHPFYMPAGEIRIADRDAYCLLVGQLE